MFGYPSSNPPPHCSQTPHPINEHCIPEKTPPNSHRTTKPRKTQTPVVQIHTTRIALNDVRYVQKKTGGDEFYLELDTDLLRT
jgi:hypothetical protein